MAEKKQKRQPHAHLDELWLVRMPGATALTRVKICDTSTKAVRVRDYDGFGDGSWYLRTDLEFIERLR